MKNITFFAVLITTMFIAAGCSLLSKEDKRNDADPIAIDTYEVAEIDLPSLISDLDLPQGATLPFNPPVVLYAQTESVMEEVDNILKPYIYSEQIPSDVKLCWSADSIEGLGYQLYALKAPEGKCAIKGSRIISAEAKDGELTLQYDEHGAKQLEEVTSRNIDKYIALVADGKVLRAPRVNMAVTGGKALLTGDYGDMEELARRINAGIGK